MILVETASIYRASLTMPEAVTDFFAVLRETGTIVGVNETPRGGVTLYLPAADVSEATHKTRLLGQALGAKGIAPAFPTDLHSRGLARVPSYRWEFDTPVYAGQGQWAILVPLTADVLHLLGVVSGLGAWADDYKGEPVLPVTLWPEDAEDLAALRGEIESELTAWFGESMRLTPQES